MKRLAILSLLALPLLFACSEKESEVHVESVSVSPSSKELGIGETVQLSAQVTPSTSTKKDISWSSSKPSVASVSPSGLVTAIGEGTATITATADGKKGESKVTVVGALSGISLSKTTLNLAVGDSETLTATPVPASATPKGALQWSSSDPQVASVDGGKVTALKAGTTNVAVSVDGFQAECSVTVNKPAYVALNLQEAKVTDKFKAWAEEKATYIDKPWYDALSAEQKIFIYPHLLVSYVTRQWYEVDNLEYIIAGEVPINAECENVGRANSSDFKIHADAAYQRIKSLVFDATIKACGGNWDYFRAYVDQHPEKLFMVSLAADKLGGVTIEDFTSSRYYADFKSILSNHNVVVSCAVANIDPNPGGDRITLNESISEKEDGMWYGSPSVNSGLNNKYTVAGYCLFEENVFGVSNLSCYAYGFDNQKNLVVPMSELYSCNGDSVSEATSTTSSFPTAGFSATLGNFLSILMKTHPGATLEGASTIMQEHYFRAETMKYKDDDGVVKEGGHWHFFKTDEFIEDEILQKDAVDAAFSGVAQVIELPSSGGLCYNGPGIQFVVDGKSYEMVEQNRSALLSALSGNKDVKWTFSRELADKYVSGSASITVRVVDHSGELIPDIKRTLTVTI